MEPRGNESIVRETSYALLKALFHGWSLTAIGAFSLLMSIRSPWGTIKLDTQALASSVFAVAGTMVALILPASQLVNGVVVQAEDLQNKIIQSADADANLFSDFVDDIKKHLSPAWRASAFVTVSFMLSIAAMILPPKEIPIWQPFELSVSSLMVTLSMGFLIVGSLWFMPTAHYAFDLGALDKMKKIVKLIASEKTKVAGKPEAPAANQVAELANQVRQEAKAKESRPGGQRGGTSA